MPEPLAGRTGAPGVPRLPVSPAIQGSRRATAPQRSESSGRAMGGGTGQGAQGSPGGSEALPRRPPLPPAMALPFPSLPLFPARPLSLSLSASGEPGGDAPAPREWGREGGEAPEGGGGGVVPKKGGMGYPRGCCTQKRADGVPQGVL